MSKLSSEEQGECIRLLKKSVLLRYCDGKQLAEIAQNMSKNVYRKDEVLSLEGQPQKKMFVIARGSVIREKTTEDGRVHHIDTFLGGQTVGSLHVLNKDPSYATSKCTSEEVVTFELSAEKFDELFKTNPEFAWNVAYSLTHEVRRHTRQLRTPLLEQQPKKTPIVAISVAAAVESFYRAALNSILNQKLTGVPMASLFPNMHIQVPTRIVYINGFKGIRQYLENNVIFNS
jgi:CRP-like cAMP-binding protein